MKKPDTDIIVLSAGVAGLAPAIVAGGTDACSIYRDTYVLILPRNTMGFALNSGRIARENAVEYVRNGFSGEDKVAQIWERVFSFQVRER